MHHGEPSGRLLGAAEHEAVDHDDIGVGIVESVHVLPVGRRDVIGVTAQIEGSDPVIVPEFEREDPVYHVARTDKEHVELLRVLEKVVKFDSRKLKFRDIRGLCQHNRYEDKDCGTADQSFCDFPHILLLELKINEIRRTVARTPDAEEQDEHDRTGDEDPPEEVVLLDDLLPDRDPAALCDVSCEQNENRDDHQPEIRPVKAQRIEGSVKEDPGILRRDHRADDRVGGPEALRPEIHPGEVHQDECNQRPVEPEPERIRIEAKEPYKTLPNRHEGLPDDLIEPVDAAPDHKMDARPVPETARQKDDHAVCIFPEFSLPAAAERYIEIIPEPGGERDVPAPPELRHRLRGVRRVEVLHQPDAEDLCRADRDRRVAREVAVDLERKEHRRDDKIPALILGVVVVDRIHHDRDAVREHEL